MSNTKFIAAAKAAPLTTIQSRPPSPSPTEIQIRIKAIAINPADTKMIDHGHRGTTYPLVAGLDGAGVVSSVGAGVTRFKPGDHVLALFSPGDKGGSYQEFGVVEEIKAAKMTGHWSFEEAASLGVCYFTAVMGLGLGLKMGLLFIQDGPREGFRPSSVLVLGGSSALGAATIQLLRLAAPSCRILATSSRKHHDRVTGYLGADVAIDRNSLSLVDDVRSSTEGKGVDAIIDTVGAGSSDSSIFEVFDADGPKRYAQVWTGEDEVQVPQGVESVLFRSRDFGLLPSSKNIMGGLSTLLEEGRYKLPLPVRNVGTGVEGLNRGLDLMRKGVSGEKLVVGLQDTPALRAHE